MKYLRKEIGVTKKGKVKQLTSEKFWRYNHNGYYGKRQLSWYETLYGL